MEFFPQGKRFCPAVTILYAGKSRCKRWLRCLLWCRSFGNAMERPQPPLHRRPQFAVIHLLRRKTTCEKIIQPETDPTATQKPNVSEAKPDSPTTKQAPLAVPRELLKESRISTRNFGDNRKFGVLLRCWGWRRGGTVCRMLSGFGDDWQPTFCNAVQSPSPQAALPHDLGASLRIAEWAYEQTERASAT